MTAVPRGEAPARSQITPRSEPRGGPRAALTAPVTAAREGQGRRFGVAIALVLLLILFTLALSIVLKPRGRDMPPELSMGSAPTAQTAQV